MLGVAAALLRGGSLAGWARLTVHWWPVAVSSLAIQIVLYDPPVYSQPWAIEFGPLVWIACLAALFVVLVRNGVNDRVYRNAWLVAAIGVGLNLLVVGANGGFMPQSVDARTAVRGHAVPTNEEEPARLWSVRPMDYTTRLAPLGDVLAEPRWLPGANVISIGDLLLGAGLTWWAFGVTRRKRTA